jgi:SAM-dependent methyltransferase
MDSSSADRDHETPDSAPESGSGHGTGAFSAATGRQLEQRGDQKNYRNYQYSLIAPHCGPELLEVGAGIGDFADQFTDRKRLIVTDVDPDAVAAMAGRFAGRPGVQARQLDLATLTEKVAEEQAEIHGLVDTVLAINVLEHIEDDVTALRSLSKLVRPGGTVVMWVPGYQQLYGDFDRQVGHVRRYTPGTLSDAALEAGLDVQVCRPVNLLGGIAWWAAVRKGGTGSPNPTLIKIYDTVVVPISRILDKAPIPFGQTILGVFRV